MSEATRLRGTTPPGRLAARRIVLRRGKRRKEIGRIEVLGEFTVLLEDGSTVHVDLAPNAVVDPRTTATVRWSELRRDQDVAPLHGKRLPDEAVVHVERFDVPGDTEVELLAIATEYEFVEAASLRGAPERRLARVTARAVTSGEDAGERMDRIVSTGAMRRRREQAAVPAHLWGARHVAIAAGAAAVLAAGALAVGPGPLRVDLLAYAAGAALYAAARAALDRTPIFVGGAGTERDRTVSSPRPVGLVVLTAVSVVATTVALLTDLGELGERAQPSFNGSPLTATALVAFAFGVYLTLALGRRRSVRALRRLARTPPFARGALDGTWGAVEGVVRDPTPVAAEMAGRPVASAVIHVVEETVVGGSDPNIFVERVLSDGTFFVDTSAGSFEVDPSAGAWASEARVIFRPGGRAARRIDHTQVVPIGGSVLVAGVARRAAGASDGALGGPDLVMFAARRGQTARATVETILRYRRVAIAGALLAAIAGIALATVGQRDLPPFGLAARD